MIFSSYITMCTQENDTKRFAFYQAGKCLVQTLLLHHPKISILKITEPSNDKEPLNNVVSFSPDLFLIEGLSFLTNNSGHAKTERPPSKTEFLQRLAKAELLHDVLQTAGSKLNSSLLTTITLETLLIGFYAGKAGEFFNHYTSEPKLQNEPGLAKTEFLQAPVVQAAGPCARTAFVNGEPLCKRWNQDSVISLLDYNKLTFTKKQRKNIIQLIDKRGCRQNKNKLGDAKTELCKSDRFCTHAPRSLLVQAAYKSVAFARPPLFFRKNGIKFGLSKQIKESPKQIGGDKNEVMQKRTLLHVRTSEASATRKRSFARTSSARAKCKNKARLFTNGLQKQSFCKVFMALHKHQLQHEYYYPVLAPLNYFLFTNRLNYTQINHLLCQSDTGSLERAKAASLAKYLLINGSIYSSNFFNLQENCKVGNLNKIEIADSKAFDFFTNFQKRITNVFFQEIKKYSLLLQEKSLNDLNVYSSANAFACKNSVKEISAWCEEKVCKALMFSTKSYGHWFRIYLPQIETHQRQPISRDQFFKVRFELELFVYDLGNVNYTQMPALLIRGTRKHNKAYTTGGSFVQAAKALYFYKPLRLVQKAEKESIAKHSFGGERYFETHFLPQDFGYGMCHNLIVNTFSQALNIIGKNRELLDIVTDHLIRFEKIRVPDILRICLLYIDDNSFI